jgi:hypothetical protein
LLQLLSNPKGPNNREKIKSLFKKRAMVLCETITLFLLGQSREEFVSLHCMTFRRSIQNLEQLQRKILNGA